MRGAGPPAANARICDERTLRTRICICTRLYVANVDGNRQFILAVHIGPRRSSMNFGQRGQMRHRLRAYLSIRMSWLAGLPG
jgi:hypothetical protein